jgi:hypothetical protein
MIDDGNVKIVNTLSWPLSCAPSLPPTSDLSDTSSGYDDIMFGVDDDDNIQPPQPSKFKSCKRACHLSQSSEVEEFFEETIRKPPKLSKAKVSVVFVYEV